MKRYFIKIVALVALIFASLPVSALDTTAEYLVESKYPLVSARIFEFQSEKAGRKYRIMVSLPGSYDASGDDTHYPVLYTVDGQWHFSIAQAAAGGLYYDRGARESIVVGITWVGDVDNANRLRVEDFTPTKTDFNPESGKADSYLDFIQYELIPYMAKNYRTSDDRTLSGSSFGGLLTLYCLFTRPMLFSDYLASTPVIWWDESVIRKFQKSFSDEGLTSPTRLYVARGGMELGQKDIDLFVSELRAEKYRNLEIEFDVIEGAGHGGLNPEAFTRGMQFIFKKNRVRIDANQLAAYAGNYKGPSGWPDIKVTSSDGRLSSTDSQSNTELQWVAVEKNLFFVANTGGEVTFSVNENNEVTQLNFKVESGVFTFVKEVLD
jgi:predicted alpha/beta superfamily hydrolase